jgi:N-acylneuraminate cytidylyltransferase
VNVDAIVLARSGSKGLPKKNISQFCGKPLVAWTIEQCAATRYVHTVWVSSDSDEILDVSSKYGARVIKRPSDISGDGATSESGWLHAIDHIEEKYHRIEVVLAPQVTSPIREVKDFERGIEKFLSTNCDSMFSSSIAKDYFIWKKNINGEMESTNYDYHYRERRQKIQEQYIENGSFYIFKPKILRQHNNRLGGKIDYVKMETWKGFEIDDAGDAKMCAALMREFILEKK